MATILKKPVTRVTQTPVRDRGSKFRQIVVTLMPGDVISLRLKGTRYGAEIAVSTIWHEAITRKAIAEKKLKAAARKAKREGRVL
ncbi:MAG: hypothetical protein ACXWHZ_03700 [Usitatibacter sp.]